MKQEKYIQQLKNKLSEAGFGSADLQDECSDIEVEDVISFTLPDFSRLIDCTISNKEAKFIVNDRNLEGYSVCTIDCNDTSIETLKIAFEIAMQAIEQADEAREDEYLMNMKIDIHEGKIINQV